MPFKTFTAGSVLTAAEANDYFMEQANITCTSGTRPGSPVEGMEIYGLTLPVAPVDTEALSGFVSNASGSARTVIAGFLTPASGVFRMAAVAGTSGVSNSSPLTWATGDQLVLTGSYEIS